VVVMVNAQVHTLHEPDGTPVCNVSFDLSALQLKATAHAAGELVVERHRGRSLELDDVLALRELTGLRDELDRLVEAEGHATLVLPLARFIGLHDALDEWVATRVERGWTREADEEALPFLSALLGPMSDLRSDALAAVLGERAGADSR
jgi:hypothetical protein